MLTSQLKEQALVLQVPEPARSLSCRFSSLTSVSKSTTLRGGAFLSRVVESLAGFFKLAWRASPKSRSLGPGHTCPTRREGTERDRQDFFWNNVVLTEGQIKKTGGSSGSYDAFALTMTCPGCLGGVPWGAELVGHGGTQAGCCLAPGSLGRKASSFARAMRFCEMGFPPEVNSSPFWQAQATSRESSHDALPRPRSRGLIWLCLFLELVLKRNPEENR